MMRLPLSESVENAIQDIPKQLTAISGILQQGAKPDDKLLPQLTTRLADVEARLHKIESLLITSTTAGKPKLNDAGKEVGRKLWYQQQ